MRALIILLSLLLATSNAFPTEYERHCRYDCDPKDKTGKRVNHGHDHGRNARLSNESANSIGSVGNPSATASGGSGGTATSGESVSNSDVVITEASDNNQADSQNTTTIEGGDTTLQTINEYEAVSQAVSSLNLAYCSDGVGVQVKDGGLNAAGMNYICEITMAIPVMLATVKADINNGNIDEAKKTLDDIRAMTREAYEYIETRGVTAPLGGFIRDTWWIIALLVLI